MSTREEILKEELNTLKEDIIKRQKDAGQYASGKTAAGYEVVVEPGHGWLGGYSYVGTLERGRRPGKAPMYFEEIIKRWIVAKGLSYSSEKELDRWARAIAWSIRKNGSFLHRYGYEVDIFSTPIKDFTERMNSRLGSFYAADILNNIFDK